MTDETLCTPLSINLSPPCAPMENSTLQMARPFCPRSLTAPPSLRARPDFVWVVCVLLFCVFVCALFVVAPPELLDGAGWVRGRRVRSLRRYDGAERGQAACHSERASGTVTSVGFMIKAYMTHWSYTTSRAFSGAGLAGVQGTNKFICLVRAHFGEVLVCHRTGKRTSIVTVTAPVVGEPRRAWFWVVSNKHFLRAFVSPQQYLEYGMTTHLRSDLTMAGCCCCCVRITPVNWVLCGD